MRSQIVVACAMMLTIGLFSFNLSAQVVPKSIQEGGTNSALRERKNGWTVGIVGGLLLRVVYALRRRDGVGAQQRGQSRFFRSCRTARRPTSTICSTFKAWMQQSLSQTCSSISAPSERRPISKAGSTTSYGYPFRNCTFWRATMCRVLKDLRGKKVNFGPAGTGASLTGTIVFQRLGINVEQVMIDQPSALQKLQTHEVTPSPGS